MRANPDIGNGEESHEPDFTEYYQQLLEDNDPDVHRDIQGFILDPPHLRNLRLLANDAPIYVHGDLAGVHIGPIPGTVQEGPAGQHIGPIPDNVQEGAAGQHTGPIPDNVEEEIIADVQPINTEPDADNLNVEIDRALNIDDAVCVEEMDNEEVSHSDLSSPSDDSSHSSDYHTYVMLRELTDSDSDTSIAQTFESDEEVDLEDPPNVHLENNDPDLLVNEEYEGVPNGYAHLAEESDESNDSEEESDENGFHEFMIRQYYREIMPNEQRFINGNNGLIHFDRFQEHLALVERPIVRIIRYQGDEGAVAVNNEPGHNEPADNPDSDDNNVAGNSNLDENNTADNSDRDENSSADNMGDGDENKAAAHSEQGHNETAAHSDPGQNEAAAHSGPGEKQPGQNNQVDNLDDCEPENEPDQQNQRERENEAPFEGLLDH